MIIDLGWNRLLKRPAAVCVLAALLGMTPWAAAQTPGADESPTPHHKAPALPAPDTSSNIANTELPKGAFNDGHHYQIADFHGKLLVLIFFSPQYDDCIDELKETVGWVKTLSDQPVAVLGIGRGTPAMVRTALHGEDPGFPIYYDTIGLYRRLWGAYFGCGCRVYTTDGISCCAVHGRIINGWGLSLNEMNTLLADSHWKYKDQNYDKRLAAVVNLLEWNHYEDGVKKLKPFRQNSNKALADSANKLYAAVAAEGESWLADADKAAADDPVKAYDLYTRGVAVFSGEELAAKAVKPLRELKAKPAVTDELAARDMFNKVTVFLADAQEGNDVQKLSDALHTVATKYPNTPTGKYAQMLDRSWGRRTMP